MAAAGIVAALVSMAAGAHPAAGSDRQPADTAPPAAIRWRTWSEEAFAEAARDRKPIFLFISADWTRASQFIDETIFVDPEVIRLANERWIPIRVERDRRPDIDLRYRLAASAILEQPVGWPLLAMLSEAGEILYGRSYIPLEDRRSGPGLRSYLSVGAERYLRNRGSAESYRPFVSRAFGTEERLQRPPEIRSGMLDEIAAGMLKALDRINGGFGEAPRIVHPFALDLAFTMYHRREDPAMLEAVILTLDAMERGAIHDRVGGGFHRTTTDPAWRRPVFEKLVNYNATILRAYATAWRLTGDEVHRRTAERTLDWILGTIVPGGTAFRVAQSASAGGQDVKGIYYAWTLADFDAAVRTELRSLAHALFEVTETGDLSLGDPPRNLLFLPAVRSEVARRIGIEPGALREGEETLIGDLAAARARRTGPPMDPAAYVDSTALVAHALIEAGALLGREDARRAGLAALDGILAAMPAEGGMMHRLVPAPDPTVDAILAQDHLMAALALAAAFEETGDRKYLDGAVDLVGRARTLFRDPSAGGYFDAPSGHEGPGYMSFRRRLHDDTGYPALNALGALVHERLALLTGDASHRSDAEACLKAIISTTGAADHRQAGLGLALDAHLRPPTRYVVVGPEASPAVDGLTRAARAVFDPGKRVVRLRPGMDDEAIAALGSDGTEAPYVVACAGSRCSAAAREPDGVAALRAPREVEGVD